MPDIKTVLKAVISRLAKQEVNARVRPLEKKIKELRRANGSQKKLMVELQKKVARISALVKPEAAIKGIAPEGLEKTRLSPAWIGALRRKLKLSGLEFGKLLGINTQTVYRWEAGKSKPLRKHRAKIIALRGLGKTKVKALLNKAG